MTKEEKAVHEFEDILGELGSTVEVTEDLRDACRTAIEALQLKSCEDKYIKEINHLRKYIIKLETQIVEQETSDDAVSRKAVLKIYDEWFTTCNIADKKESPKSKIKALPPVTPQPKTGHWIKEKSMQGWDGKSYQCSECGRSIHIDPEVEDLSDYPYCHCGSKMINPQEGEISE